MQILMRVPEKGIRAGTTSMGASFNGTPTKVDVLEGYSICASVVDAGADLVGTLKIQVANNVFANNTSNELTSYAVWIDLPGSEVALDGGNDSVIWNVSEVFYEAFRLVWTRTSGSGTIEMYIIGKGNP